MFYFWHLKQSMLKTREQQTIAGPACGVGGGISASALFSASSSTVLTGEGEGRERPGRERRDRGSDGWWHLWDPPSPESPLVYQRRATGDGLRQSCFCQTRFGVLVISSLEQDLCPLLSFQPCPMVAPFIRASKTYWRSIWASCKVCRLFCNTVGSWFCLWDTELTLKFPS